MKTPIYIVTRYIPCATCGGSGSFFAVPPADPAQDSPCKACGGEGITAYEEVPLEVALQALGVNLADLRALLAEKKGGDS